MKRSLKLRKKIYKDYYVKRISSKEIAIKYNLKPKTVSYELSKVNVSRWDYILKTISKSKLEEIYSQKSFIQTCDYFKISRRYLENLLKYYSIKKKGLIKNTIDSTFYINKPLSFFYYCGLVASDGYIKNNSQVRITIKNKGSEALLSKLGYLVNFKGALRTTRRGYNEVTFTDTNLVKELNLYGIPSYRKTYTLKCPSLSKKELACYLTGLLDGDGTIFKRHMGFKIINYLHSFLEDLNNFIYYHFQIKGKIAKDGSIYTLTFNSKEAYILLSYMYNNCPLYLECKFNRFVEKSKKFKFK